MGTSIGFSEDGFDWDRYKRVRPQYPESLWKRILDYHQSHSHDGGLGTAHDVGAGHGIVAKDFLLPNFQHVFVSDPGAYNINAARKYLSKEADGGRVTFNQCGGETQWLTNASLDMITAFECVHWMDVDKAVPSMAAALKPGGTMAIVFYFPQPFIRDDKKIGQAWQSIWNKFSEKLRAVEDWDFMRNMLHRSAEGLDSALPLSSDLFQENAQRIRINAHLLKDNSHGNPDHPFHFSGLGAMGGGVPSHVTETDERSSIVDEDWAQSVDLEWLKDVMQGIQPALPENLSVREFAEIGDALQQEGGETSVFWVVDVVLATKK